MSEPEKPVLVAVEAPAPVAAPEAPPATPVVAQEPSSSVVQEIVASVVLSVEDAVDKLVALVKDHRRAGDVDVENALTDVAAALAAKK